MRNIKTENDFGKYSKYGFCKINALFLAMRYLDYNIDMLVKVLITLIVDLM